MDFKFPTKKDYKTRYCFQCNKLIDFSDYYIRNKTIREERLIQLWENNHLEFFCCLCYDDFIRNEKLKNLKNSLSDEQLDILKILEKKCKIDIPIVMQIKYDTVGISIQNGEIKGLSLFNCLNFFPEEITLLKSLEILNIAWNYLDSFPKTLYNLSSLKILDLLGNKLTHIHENIKRMNLLNELDLSFNNIKTLPKTIGNLTSLKTLNLIHNPLTHLPESLKILENKGVKVLY